MIGKIIGAVAGSQASKHVRGLSGTGGARLGAAVPILLGGTSRFVRQTTLSRRCL